MRFTVFSPSTASTVPLSDDGTCAGWVLAYTVEPLRMYCSKLVLNALAAAAAVPFASISRLLGSTVMLVNPKL